MGLELARPRGGRQARPPQLGARGGREDPLGRRGRGGRDGGDEAAGEGEEGLGHVLSARLRFAPGGDGVNNSGEHR